MAKMSNPFIALCSAAIGAIYAAGYLTTENHANALAVDQHIQTAQHAQANPQSSAKQASGTYKDGTYTGTGSNRRGSIMVDVTIKNDKITDVTISNFAMHYSESDVVGLPNEVLQLQSPNVNNVSGATYSTQAFQNAVQDALAQARNA